MRYAKIIDGQTIYAPSSLMIGEQWYSNPTDEQYRVEGYEPVAEPNFGRTGRTKRHAGSLFA